MPRQDWDPLADSLPPRYAYESDDEDETGLANIASRAHPETSNLDITFLPRSQTDTSRYEGGVLIVASGAVGAVWARGAKLGEQIGQVNINKRAIGFIFRPTWFNTGVKGMVLISESFTRLPVWTMSPYAAAILERWKPSRVVLVDAYSTATYVTPTPIPHHEAPLRFLSTERKTSSLGAPLPLFAPPNLLQSTTAAFLNFLALPELSPQSQHRLFAFAILVPSGRVPLPIPRSLSRDEDSDGDNNLSLADLSSLDSSEDWDPAIITETHRAILQISGLASGIQDWAETRTHTSPKSLGRRRRLTESEEGMYI